MTTPFDKNVVGECGSSEIHDSHYFENGICYGVHELSNYDNFEWITLPGKVPEGKEPGSGYWVRLPSGEEMWIDFSDDDEDARFFLDGPPSDQSMTAATAETPAPLDGGSRSRRAGIRIGTIVGTLVRGLLSTRGLAKKQVVEKNDGRGYSVEREDWEQ